MTQKEQDFLEFIQKRMHELHEEIFSKEEPKLHKALTYFAYNALLFNSFQKGTDYSTHPRNPFRKTNL